MAYPKNHPKTLAELDKIRLDCKELISARAKISAGVAIVPIPFLDVAVDVGLLSKLLPEIAYRFGLTDAEDPSNIGVNEKERTANLIARATAVAGLIATRGTVNKMVQGFGGRILGKQVAKYVPFGGQIVAGTLGYVIFRKIATDHMEQCYEVAKRKLTQAQPSV